MVAILTRYLHLNMLNLVLIMHRFELPLPFLQENIIMIYRELKSNYSRFNLVGRNRLQNKDAIPHTTFSACSRFK